MYPVAIVSHRPQKSPNCISLHCIRLQKKPPVLQIVSGCSCIRLHLYPLQLYLIVSEGGWVPVSVYPVAIVSRYSCNCISLPCIRLQLYLVTLYPVAVVSRCVSGCNCIRLQLYPVAIVSGCNCFQLQLCPTQSYPVTFVTTHSSTCQSSGTPPKVSCLSFERLKKF